MGLSWDLGGLLLLGGLSMLGLSLQGLQIRRLEEALGESRAALARLRATELEWQRECRELRSALCAERGYCERLEAQLALLRR